MKTLKQFLLEGNRELDYEWYVLDRTDRKIVSGWDYPEDAKEFISDVDIEESDLGIYTPAFLIRNKLIPTDVKNWKEFLNLDRSTY